MADVRERSRCDSATDRESVAKAWEIRKKIVSTANAVPGSDNLRAIWDATIDDVKEFSSVGPFVSEEEVTKFLGQEDWIPTQRFEVVQKNKVRGRDSVSSNMINPVTKISEKLQLPPTDLNVSVIRELRTAVADRQIAGWVLDKRKAYRQIAIHPDHRKFSVICLKDPQDSKAKFFVMIGHSFGLVSSVYNCNRRSSAINEILKKIFSLVAFNFYDDKYGFEPKHTIDSAFKLPRKFTHSWVHDLIRRSSRSQRSL